MRSRVASDRWDGEPRTYRLSQIREPAILEEPAIRPAEFDMAAWWERSAAEFREKLPRYYAAFLVNPSALRWAAGSNRKLPMATGCACVCASTFEEEALQFTLSFGGDVEVIEPAELRTRVLVGAFATVQRYEGRVTL